MKRISVFCFLCFALLFWGTGALAIPLDLSGFSPDSGVTLSGGEVSFTEDVVHGEIYFQNLSYFVDGDAGILSFDYQINLGSNDTDDYLTFAAYDSSNNSLFGYEFPEYLSDDHGKLIDEGILKGHFIIDFAPFRGQTINIAWGFIEGDMEDTEEDENYSTAIVYNIDLATESTAPVPEPATFLLLGTGLAGLCGLRSRRKLRVS